MRAAAKLAARGSRCRSRVAWRLPPPAHRPVRLAHVGGSRELLGVHPSSLIGANASVAPGARIGPFCVVSDDAVIGPNCELGAGVHVLGATTLGADCVVRSHAVVGSPEPGTVALGRGVVVGAHAVVGAACADKKHSPSVASHLVIGDRVDIREHVTIHRSSGPETVTKIGNECLLMGGAHVGHDCVVGDGAVVSNGALLAGHVTVGDRAVLGGAVAVSQRNGVGAHAFVAGGARVDGWVPACARGPFRRGAGRGGRVRWCERHVRGPGDHGAREAARAGHGHGVRLHARESAGSCGRDERIATSATKRMDGSNEAFGGAETPSSRARGFDDGYCRDYLAKMFTTRLQ